MSNPVLSVAPLSIETTMSPRKSAKGKNTKAQTKGPKVEKPMNGGKPWTHEHVALLCEERGKEPSSSHGKIGIILGRTPQSCRLKYMHMNDAEKAAVKSKPSRVANRTQVDPGSQTIGYDNLQNTGSDAATALPASSSAVHQTVEIAPSSAQEPGYVLEQAGGDAATALPASSSSVHQAVEKGLSSSPESEHVLEEAGLSTNEAAACLSESDAATILMSMNMADSKMSVDYVLN